MSLIFQGYETILDISNKLNQRLNENPKIAISLRNCNLK